MLICFVNYVFQQKSCKDNTESSRVPLCQCPLWLTPYAGKAKDERWVLLPSSSSLSVSLISVSPVHPSTWNHLRDRSCPRLLWSGAVLPSFPPSLEQ